VVASRDESQAKGLAGQLGPRARSASVDTVDYVRRYQSFGLLSNEVKDV
jgi:hypothetical protein